MYQFHVDKIGDAGTTRHDDCFPSAGISESEWEGRILVWGDTETEAEQIRDYIFKKLTDSPWTACSDQMPDNEAYVDIIILSTQNPLFQHRVINVTYKDDLFMLPVDAQRLMDTMSCCYIGFWMNVPKLVL